MIILEKNPLLVDMLAYIKEHIAASDFDPAANTLRKIGEHMAKRLIIGAGLWDEACTDKNGKKYDEPSFSRSIYLLNKNHIIKRQEYDEVYNPLLKFGNAGSHTVGNVENYEVIYAYEKTKKYVESVFLTKYPDAARHGILPAPRVTKRKPEPPKSTTVRHTHTRGSWKTTKASTCTSTGEEAVMCTSCGQLLDRRTIPKKEHAPSGWIVDYPATVGKNGRKYQECKACGMRLSIVDIPALPYVAPTAKTDEGESFRSNDTKCQNQTHSLYADFRSVHWVRKLGSIIIWLISLFFILIFIQSLVSNSQTNYLDYLQTENSFRQVAIAAPILLYLFVVSYVIVENVSWNLPSAWIIEFLIGICVLIGIMFMIFVALGGANRLLMIICRLASSLHFGFVGFKCIGFFGEESKLEQRICDAHVLIGLLAVVIIVIKVMSN